MMELRSIESMDLVNMIQWTNENQFPIQGIMVEGTFNSKSSDYLVNIKLYDNHNGLNPHAGRTINAIWAYCSTASDILEIHKIMNNIHKELEKAFKYTDVNMVTKYLEE